MLGVAELAGNGNIEKTTSQQELGCKHGSITIISISYVALILVNLATHSIWITRKQICNNLVSFFHEISPKAVNKKRLMPYIFKNIKT